MEYIKRAIKTVRNNFMAYYLFVFAIFIPHISGPLKQAAHLNGMAYIIIMAFVICLSLFIVAGAYGLLIHEMESSSNLFVDAFQHSRKYFARLLMLSIVIAVCSSIYILIFFILTRAITPINSLLFNSGNYSIYNVLGSLVGFFVALFFLYAIPGVYSHDLKDSQVITMSFKFLRKNFLISMPIVGLLALSFLINELGIRAAIGSGYNSTLYWIVMALMTLVSKTINLTVFLAAVLILKDHFNMRYTHDRI